MTSLGQELRKEREARNISLDDVVNSTRILRRYLEAVENDHFDALPGKFFVKGIVRSYAKAVGLDEEEWVERFRRAGVFGEPAAESRGVRLPVSRLSRKTKLSLAGGITVILIVGTFGLFYLLRSGKTASVPATKTETFQDTAPAVPAPRVETPAEPAPQTVPAEEKGLRLELSFRDKTWIQVYADGKLALDGIKVDGDRVLIRAETEILIHLGNAGGLGYTLNGKPGKGFGRPGAVVKNIRITLDNMGQYVAAEGTV
jgi:cytoskeletal protein RodZ